MKICSIDFDIIMSPSIELYNHLIDTDNPMKNIVEEYSAIANLPADLYQYEYLTRFILMASKNVKKIYFIEDHSKMVDIIKTLPRDEEIEVVNIDHHHDAGYDLPNWHMPLREADCSDWVKYLRDRKLIHKYTWIKNKNSQDIDKSGKNYIDAQNDFDKTSLENLSKDIDYLVICSSYDWIPPIYQPLFMTWETICENTVDKERLIDNFK